MTVTGEEERTVDEEVDPAAAVEEPRDVEPDESSRREEPEAPGEGEEADDRLDRYDLFERVLHWVVGLTFVALMVSGLALAYPRLAWLDVFFGGGQTMRAAHPWIGLVFTAGVVVMLLIWAKDMLLHKVDWAWFRRIGQYARTGHAGLDIGRWNAGQKAYFWLALGGGVLLLVTGIPLWDRDLAGAGMLQLARLLHHVLFLVMVGGFIIHVLLSAFMFPGTMDGMLSGKVTRAWAAWHHPRWFRQQTGRDSPSTPPAGEGDPAGKLGGRGVSSGPVGSGPTSTTDASGRQGPGASVGVEPDSGGGGASDSAAGGEGRAGPVESGRPAAPGASEGGGSGDAGGDESTGDEGTGP